MAGSTLAAWRTLMLLWSSLIPAPCRTLPHENTLGAFGGIDSPVLVPMVTDGNAWGGVFAGEATAAVRPQWYVLFSDTNVTPTALFEVGDLARLGRAVSHHQLPHASPGCWYRTIRGHQRRQCQ